MTETVGRNEEVPFGIRAIERGCMVEGVWNSKASTPLQTSSSSKASSPALKGKNTLRKHKRESSSSNVSQLDMPQPALVPPTTMDLGVGLEDSLPENFGMQARNQVAEDIQELECGTSANDRLSDGSGPALYREKSLATTYGLPPFEPGSRPGLSWIRSGTLALTPEFFAQDLPVDRGN